MVFFQCLQQCHHGFGFCSTHAGHGFVQQQHLRLGGQDHGDFKLTLNAVAQNGGSFVFRRSQTRQLQSAVCTLCDVGLLVSATKPRQGLVGCQGVFGLRGQHQVLPHGQRQKHIGLLVTASQTLQGQTVVRPTRDRLPLEPQLAPAGWDITAEQMGEGGFTRAIGADHGVQLVFVKRQRHIIDRQQPAKAFTQMFGF